MKTARPFTYHQQSIKYGVVQNSEIKYGKYLLGIPVVLWVILFYLDKYAYMDDMENKADLEKAIERRKKASA